MKIWLAANIDRKGGRDSGTGFWYGLIELLRGTDFCVGEEPPGDVGERVAVYRHLRDPMPKAKAAVYEVAGLCVEELYRSSTLMPLVNGVDHLVSPTQYALNRILRANVNVCSSVIPRYLDPDRFPVGPRSLDDPFRSLILSSYHSKKNSIFSMLASLALADLSKTETTCVRVAVGSDPHFSDSFADISYMDPVPHPQVSELYRNHHVFFANGGAETWPGPACEAIMSGVPTLLPRAPYVLEHLWSPDYPMWVNYTDQFIVMPCAQDMPVWGVPCIHHMVDRVRWIQQNYEEACEATLKMRDSVMSLCSFDSARDAWLGLFERLGG